MRHPREIGTAAWAILWLLAGGLSAAMAEDNLQPVQIDEQAKAVVDRMGKFYSGLKGLQTRMVAQISTEVAGQKFDMKLEHVIAAERPNRFALEVANDTEGVATGVVKSDGEKLIVYLGAFGKYLEVEAPASLAELTKNPLVAGISGAGNSGLVTLALISDDPAATLLEKVETLKYLGKEKIDGVECDHLAATQEDFDWEIWIASGDKPLVQQFKPDLAKAFRKMAEQANNPDIAKAKISNVVRYTEWKLEPPAETATFAFTPPEGAKKVDSMSALISGERANPAEQLVGKPAPNFTLDLLEGGQMELASHRGQDVVILDFWATWCGPCRQAMPVIEKVAKQYEGKGVVLYAVNLEEQPDQIREALEQDGISPTVAMDVEGKVARLYLAQAIPQTVIIGKDGTVQAVHIGLLPNLEEQLRSEIDTLLAGKSLADSNSEGSDSEEESNSAAASPAGGN